LKSKFDLACSIVLYKTKESDVRRAIDSSLNSSIRVKIIIVDNSPTNELKKLENISGDIEYIFNNANLGYGTAHNIAIRKSISEGCAFHLVLNPDVYFPEDTLEKILTYMRLNQDVGQVLPKVLYPDGSTQYLAKLLPTPINLIFRRFLPVKSLVEKLDKTYELRFTGYDKIMSVPNLSGCFMFLRCSIFEKIDLFDENIFLHLEDIDLSRRINREFKTIFFPEAIIYHEFAKGSHTSFKIMMMTIKSAIYYFNKWGWIFDKHRRTVNKKTLKNLGY